MQLRSSHFCPCSSLAKWETNFDPKSTKKRDFHVTSKRAVPVPMMKREDQYLYLVDRKLFCKMVGVPYQGNATAFFILPDEGKMGQLEAGLNKETLRKWIKMLTKRYSSDSTRASLTLHTPRETPVPKGHSVVGRTHSPRAVSKPRGIRGSPSSQGLAQVQGAALDACFPGGAIRVDSDLWGSPRLSPEWDGLYSRQGAEGRR